jgi:hypothetical protein
MDPIIRNNRAPVDTDKEPCPHLKSRIDDILDEETKMDTVSLPIINPSDLTGKFSHTSRGWPSPQS